MRPAYDHLQVLRGVACTMVLLGHVRGYMAGERWPWLVPFGFPWVWIFLVLSGFLLTRAFTMGRFRLDANGIAAFYRNRAFRLYPLLLTLGALWLVLSWLHLWSVGLRQPTFWHELSVALALPWVPYTSLNPIASANSPVWSAVLEVHYCLAMPVLLKWRNGQVLRWLFAAWVLWMAWLAANSLLSGPTTIFPGVYQQHAYNFGFFAAGMLVALRAEASPPSSLRGAVPLMAATGLFGAMILVAQYLPVGFALCVLPLPLLASAVLLVGTLDSSYQAALPTTLREMWSVSGPTQVLERVGMMSYSVYLCHKPLGYLLIDWLGLSGGGVATILQYALACVLLTISLWGLSTVFFLHVERRFRVSRPPQPMTAPMVT